MKKIKTKLTNRGLGNGRFIEIAKDPGTQVVTRQEEGKTTSIKDLPDCPHKELLMKIVQDPDRSKVCAVAFLYSRKVWDATIGYPDIRDLKIVLPDDIDKYLIGWQCENINDVESVTMMGVKLPKEIAIQLFPDWSAISYLEDD